MKLKRRSLTAAVSLLWFAAACSSTKGTSGSGGAAGSSAESGAAGSPAPDGEGGSGGVTAGCPATLPLYQYSCPVEQLGTDCTYAVTCQTGIQNVTLRCGQHGWAFDPSAACLNGDFCPVDSNYQLQCVGGTWSPGGGGETGLCATERVPNGSACYRSALDATPGCGYYCPDGTWTVGFCGAGSLGEQVYEFTPPCAGEDLPSAGAAGAAGN